MVDGIETKLGGKDYVVPAAPLGAIKLWMRAQKQTEPNSVERVDAMIAFVSMTLRRNHPEATQEYVEANMDVSDLRVAMRVVAEAGGLREQAPGEAEPGTSTGTESTQTS